MGWPKRPRAPRLQTALSTYTEEGYPRPNPRAGLPAAQNHPPDPSPKPPAGGLSPPHGQVIAAHVAGYHCPSLAALRSISVPYLANHHRLERHKWLINFK